MLQTPSVAYIEKVNSCSLSDEFERVDHRAQLPVTDQAWKKLTEASAADPVLRKLHNTISHGWPEEKKDAPECPIQYFDFRDEMTVQDQLIYKGQQLVVPRAVRRELMEQVHSSHIGIEGCLRRARERAKRVYLKM